MSTKNLSTSSEKSSPWERLAPYKFPGKLTPQFRAHACELVRQGVPPRVALRRTGITRQSILNWERKRDEGDAQYVALFCALDEAWADWQTYVAGHLPQHIANDARMCVEVAGRIMPDEYGKKDELQVSVQVDPGPVLQAIAAAQQKLLNAEYSLLPADDGSNKATSGHIIDSKGA